MKEITQEYVRNLFKYKDGFLFWKNVNPNRMVKNGDIAGSLHHTGYYIIGINSKYYQSHRLIYLYYKGYLPKYIDHIDGNPSNNNINNLREVTQSQNCMNKKSDKNSSSKFKGVSWDKSTNKWRARIQVNSKQIHLGRFKSEIDAAKCYNNAAIKYFKEFAYLNEVK